jgi:hypothetical protein
LAAQEDYAGAYQRQFEEKSNAKSKETKRFIAFVQSPPGRRSIEGNGQWIP